jgi:hypothetical protein
MHAGELTTKDMKDTPQKAQGAQKMSRRIARRSFVAFHPFCGFNSVLYSG